MALSRTRTARTTTTSKAGPSSAAWRDTIAWRSPTCKKASGLGYRSGERRAAPRPGAVHPHCTERPGAEGRCQDGLPRDGRCFQWAPRTENAHLGVLSLSRQALRTQHPVMTQQVAPVLWLTEQTGCSWHSTLNFQEGKGCHCQNTLLGGAGNCPLHPASPGRAGALRTSCTASQQWPGSECRPSAHWAEKVNSDLLTHSGRMQSGTGLPSTFLTVKWTCWAQEGNLCRAEGPGSSSPKGCRHPVTRMNVTLREHVWWLGLLSSVPKQSFQAWAQNERVPAVNPTNLCCDVT